MLSFLLLISLVSYPNNFIYSQRHCGFNIWSLLLSLPCFKHKGEIFRLPVVKRSLLGISYSISFLHIPYSLKFCIVLHINLLCFRVICLLYVCIRKLIFNSLICLLVFFILILRCLFLISLVSYMHNLISFQRYCALSFIFLSLVFTFDFYSFRYLL